MIDFVFENVQKFKENQVRQVIERSVFVTLKEIKFKKNFYLSVLVTNNIGIKKINKEYRKINKFTNVLSFPQNEIRFFNKKQQKIIIGDIVFSLEKILQESKDQKKSFSDHLSHMTIHGVLHLLGFEHKKHKDFITMKNKEILVLSKMEISSPY